MLLLNIVFKLPFADKVAQWTVKHMQDKEGFFYYKSHRIHKDKIPYIRWGQAWMLYGMSFYLLEKDKNEKINGS